MELAPRTTYYSALTSANGYNFFGPLISSTAVDETIQVPHLDSTSAESAKLDVILQGVILGVPHDVTVTLNGTSLGDVTFTGEAKGTLDLTLPPGVLQEGANTVTLTSQNGEYDYSLLQSIRITYPHTYAADSNELTFTGRPGDELKLTGFTQSSVAVVDITDPNQPVQLTPQVTYRSEVGNLHSCDTGAVVHDQSISPGPAHANGCGWYHCRFSGRNPSESSVTLVQRSSRQRNRNGDV